ncbi:hypothetical protein PHMEG_00016312 [Phytophthora megakarya]|uniref:Uncharacterized protein n=1 Tax=Phytophthora megakarya TaxID=4795 RepID=A0A225VZA4_9STRA|nr:hypothetical protein PHMEG_00016312 [Phytophthora megakarya]
MTQLPSVPSLASTHSSTEGATEVLPADEPSTRFSLQYDFATITNAFIVFREGQKQRVEQPADHAIFITVLQDQLLQVTTDDLVDEVYTTCRVMYMLYMLYNN